MPYNPDAHSTITYTKPGQDFQNKEYICRICKVPVMSKTDHSAKLGHEHKKNCPRRKLGR